MSDDELKSELSASAMKTPLSKRSCHRHPHEGREKGAVSIYGMGRFPVTLYKEQCRSYRICGRH